MALVIVVKDAAGAPVLGAKVVRTDGNPTAQGTTDAAGRTVFADVPTTLFTVDVTHPSYLDEQVNVRPAPTGGSVAWDNPVCVLNSPSTFEVRMSRVRAAPTFSISNNDLEQRAPFGPQAAFTWTDGNGNTTGRYLAMFNDPVKEFVAVSHPLLPELLTDGWGRISHAPQPVAVDPSRSGDLVWLEWGLGSAEPRLSVAAWIPRFRETTSQLDFVFFFSPNTGNSAFPSDTFPWLGKYPYWADKGSNPLRPGGPLPLVQSYLALAHRYLFIEKWLIGQLLAAKRQAVVVFPVQPFGSWGPFGQIAGLARLTSEITHFIQRTGHMQAATQSDQDIAPLPRYRIGRAGVQQPSASVRRIVLSGFSAGMSPVIEMLGTQVGQRLTVPDMNHELFGAEVSPFLTAWKEVWDHDAPDAVRKSMDSSLPAWLRRDSGRMARCYQSEHTGSRGWIDTTPLNDFVSAPKKPPGLFGSKERHSEARCSLAFFGAGHLHHASSAPAIPPAFWTAKDDHQAVPMVTFGHAARLSGLASG